MKDSQPQSAAKAQAQALLARQQLYQIITAIPYGKVASYRQLATFAGYTCAAR